MPPCWVRRDCRTSRQLDVLTRQPNCGKYAADQPDAMSNGAGLFACPTTNDCSRNIERDVLAAIDRLPELLGKVRHVDQQNLVVLLDDHRAASCPEAARSDGNLARYIRLGTHLREVSV